MIKYFCDKCGKEIGDFNMNEIFTVKVEPPEVRSWTDEAEAGTYILCHECVRKLNDWIKKNSGLLTAIQAVHDLPSEDRPSGKWIEINVKDYKAKCSHCGTWSPIMGNFCPNCGARMEGE